MVRLPLCYLEAARDREDEGAIVSLSKRLGALLEARSPEGAKDVYRRMLDFKPDDRDVLEALARLCAASGDTREQAEALERVLQSAADREAERLALEVGGLFKGLEDSERARAAFERGFAAYPQSHKLRTELETSYRESHAWEKLATTFGDKSQFTAESWLRGGVPLRQPGVAPRRAGLRRGVQVPGRQELPDGAVQARLDLLHVLCCFLCC